MRALETGRKRTSGELFWPVSQLSCNAKKSTTTTIKKKNKQTNKQKQKQPPNFLNRVEAIVVLIVLNCILCDARIYTATVLFNYRSSI